jgi:hypothetical protein
VQITTVHFDPERLRAGFNRGGKLRSGKKLLDRCIGVIGTGHFGSSL